MGVPGAVLEADLVDVEGRARVGIAMTERERIPPELELVLGSFL